MPDNKKKEPVITKKPCSQAWEEKCRMDDEKPKEEKKDTHRQSNPYPGYTNY